jgi:hypothetical protein
MPNFAPSSDLGRAARSHGEDTLHWLTALARHYDRPEYWPEHAIW